MRVHCNSRTTSLPLDCRFSLAMTCARLSHKPGSCIQLHNEYVSENAHEMERKCHSVLTTKGMKEREEIRRGGKGIASPFQR